MANLNALSIEILQNIIMNIPRRFRTELLLLNKTLCSLFMAEQVRNLELNSIQLRSWITIVTSDDIKMPCPDLRYCNLLNKVTKLDVIFDHNLSEKQIGRFITRCVNLRIIILKNFSRLNTTSLIFSNLPFNIVEMYFIGFIIKNEEEAYSFISYVKRNSKLEILYFKYANVESEVAIWEELLNVNSAIKQLHLKVCQIGNKGIHGLAEVLKQNTKLTSLSLNWNQINSEGTHALAEALKQNTALTNLNLHNNRIGVKGARALAEALKQNTTLTNLNLSCNEIGAEGAHALTEGLRQNTALATLNLSWNGVVAKYVPSLLEILEQKTDLVVLV